MKRAIVGILVLAGCSSGPAAVVDVTEKGHALYSEGKFSEAEKELERVVAKHPDEPFARRLLGRLYLMTGRHREAAEQFLKYVEFSEKQHAQVDAMTIQDLFWAFYRQDDYSGASKAARLLQDTVLQAKYERMAQRTPYASNWRDESVTLWPDERHLYPVTVNGQEGRFAIDFGAGEMTLDPDFARRVRAIKVGVRGSMASEQQGFVDLVEFPGTQIKNVPIVFAELPKAGDRAIDGVLGVGFLSHFFPTIDGRRGRLTLRVALKKDSGGAEIPFYFAGDRTVFLSAFVDNVPTYAVVNPTLAGVRFIPSQSILLQVAKARNVDYDKVKLEKVRFASVEIPADGSDPSRFPPGLDMGFGFPLGGILGADAFRGKLVTFDFRRMRLTID